MSPDERAAYIRALVDEAPPLTDEQAELLRTLLTVEVRAAREAVPRGA